ncbi:MAG: flagellar biosynthetic protein FliO [Bacillota bacterium]
MDFEKIISLLGLVIGIGIFFYFVYLFTKMIANFNKKIYSGKNIKVIEKIPIDNNKFLTLVTLDKKSYLLSVTKDDVKLIDDVDDLNIKVKKEDDNNFNKILKEKLKWGKKNESINKK